MGPKLVFPPNFGGKLSFILSILFPERLHCSAATYIFTAHACTSTIISLEPCALNAEFQHFMLRYNKQKFYYRKWVKAGPKEGEDRVTLQIILIIIVLLTEYSFSTGSSWYLSDEQQVKSHCASSFTGSSKEILQWNIPSFSKKKLKNFSSKYSHFSQKISQQCKILHPKKNSFPLLRSRCKNRHLYTHIGLIQVCLDSCG